MIESAGRPVNAQTKAPPTVLTIASSWRVALRLLAIYFPILGSLLGVASIGGGGDYFSTNELWVAFLLTEGFALITCVIVTLAMSAKYIHFNCRGIRVRLNGSTVVVSKHRAPDQTHVLGSREILMALPPRWPEYWVGTELPEFTQIYIIARQSDGRKSIVHLGQVVLYGSLYRRWLSRNSQVIEALDLSISNYGFNEFPNWRPVYDYGNPKPKAWKAVSRFVYDEFID